jgi:uncharacterized protein (TIGR02594 family)
VNLTAYDLAQRFVGVIRERPGSEEDEPFVLWCLELVGMPSPHDEVPWCSAFANGIAWLLRLPRSKSPMARSWLGVGKPVNPSEAKVGYDVVIFKRGEGEQPGPENLSAPGHVAFYAGQEAGAILALGGNQGDAVTIARFSRDHLLGIRRLYEDAA